MKNKKTTYLLLLLVALVWGGVILQIIKHLKQSANPEVLYNIPSDDDVFVLKDTIFELSLDYSDPFLKWNGSSTVKASEKQKGAERNATSIKNRLNNRKENIKKKTIIWPDITYSGLIKNNETNELVGLLTINEKTFLLREGESVESVFLSRFYADSITVIYKEEAKTIKK